MKEYLKTISLSLIPTFLIFIGKSDGFFNFLKEHNFLNEDDEVSTYQFWCFLVGCFWAGLVIPVQFAKTKMNLKEKEDDFNELLKFNKDIYFKSAKQKIKKQSASFRTRVFVPKKNIFGQLNKIRNKRKEFHLKYFKSISDTISNKNLHFEVTPNIQGMVGRTFECKSILIDFDVQKTDYNLTHYQKSNTMDVKFCSTVPIFNKENEVKAIISVDSEKEIILKDSEIKEWEKSLAYYGSIIDKHLKL